MCAFGDRLTDERIQGAQRTMNNAPTPREKLQGFISKIEDWHRIMNFLEVLCQIDLFTSSERDRGTVYYFRNVLNARNVKSSVKNSFRAYKMLYYTIFDASCCTLFLMEFNIHDLKQM
ncbi:uncharacterized protein LOC133198121 [Saccostrea echinata]|uniref:uncharacterized protein LOC133198121 n=1 Tax=Saccostrea echinata TaxID=191078 RepID=UPI002A82ABF3|nr:uncharacterized protein LOC133198121 [Saccostrea echinata]